MFPDVDATWVKKTGIATITRPINAAHRAPSAPDTTCAGRKANAVGRGIFTALASQTPAPAPSCDTAPARANQDDHSPHDDQPECGKCTKAERDGGEDSLIHAAEGDSAENAADK